MKLTHLYAVCACALLSLGAVNADNAYAQKAPAKKEAAAAHKNAPVPVDRIAAVVNHDVITEIQLQQRIHQVATNLRRRNIPLPPMDNLRDQRLRERDVDDKIQIPESEIDQYLKDQSGPGKRMEYRLSRIVISFPENPTKAEVEAAQRTASRALEQAQRGADFSQLAAKYSVTPEAMEGGVMGWVPAGKLPPFVVQALQNHKAGDIIPLQAGNSFQILKLTGVRDPGEQAQQGVRQTHVRHIMMRPSNVTPEKVVIQRLNEIKSRLDKGDGDFQTLARLHSADPSGTRGGDLGWLYPGDVPPEMEQQLDKLSVGEISEPIRTPYGWHIFQVLDRRTKSGINERQREQAREALREQKLGDAVLDWERRLRSEAYVEKRINKPTE